MKNPFKRFSAIFKQVKLPWGMLLVVLLISLLFSHLELKQITLTANIIDGSQQAIKTELLIEYVVTMAVYAMVRMLLTYTRKWSNERINLGVRTRLWEKVLRLPTSYYDKENADALVSRVTTDASQSYIYFQTIINVITAIYAAVISMKQMFAYSPKLASYSMIVIPIGVVVSVIFGKINQFVGIRTQSTFAATTAYLVERTRNLRLVKASLMELPEQLKGKKFFQQQYIAGIWNTLASSSSIVVTEFISCATMIISFVVGGRLVAAGEIRIAHLIGFYTISGMVFVRLAQLMTYYNDMKRATGQLVKIAEVMEADEEKRGGIELDIADADIKAAHIHFSYGQREVLNDLSFTIPKGKVTAIIGPNGAGKSTVFKLLERMYDPDEGRLLFGDTDVRTFDIASWRDSFAIVSQDKPLLSGSVKDNITYGTRRLVAEEEIIRVAKLANIYDFVMATPGGFDAPVGMGGQNFSGGQRQCIAIARAMMRNPDYLLLDEATSNLDAKSEGIVSQALDHLMQGRTTVMIAHNYSATRNADHVIVLKDGHVEAEGTPEDLMESNEYYRNFANKAQVTEGGAL